jgi:DNA-binding CsgD family transcriptional regulator
MPASQRVSVFEVRLAFRLIGEVCELGDDVAAWRRHLAEGLNRLVGSQVAMIGEFDHGPLPHRPNALQFTHGCDSYAAAQWTQALARVNVDDFGWSTDRDRRSFVTFVTTHPPSADPLFAYYMRHQIGTAYTIARRDVVEDYEWHRSLVYQFRREAGTDDCLHSSQPLSRPGWHFDIQLLKPVASPPFTPRECQLVNLVNEELALLWQRAATAAAEQARLAPRDHLPPRQRQTLDLLAQGLSEKQVAGSLGLSPLTVHNYIKALHQRFNASNRVELLRNALPATAPVRRLAPRLAMESPALNC